MMDLKKLIAVGAHFGHQTSRWCPKMARYIWGHKNNVHLIDVSKTAYELERAAQFLKETTAEGKNILWVGTKKAAQDSIRSAADMVGMPHVTHRWIGGTLSNYTQVKKSVTKLLHYEDIINKAEKFPHYTKKELNTFGKIADRLRKNVGGIKNLMWPLGAVVVVDVSKEKSAIKEAATMGIPVVAIVDTNGDPSNIDFVIPANDDAPRVIKLLTEYLAEAACAGKEVALKKIAAQEVEAEAKRAARKTESKAESKAAGQPQQEADKGAEAGAKKPSARPMTKRPAPAAADKKKETQVKQADTPKTN